MIDCERNDLRDRLPEYVHGTLGRAEREAVESHLEACASCRAEAALLRDMRQALTRVTPRVDVARIAAAARAVPRSRTAAGSAPRRSSRPIWYAAAAALLLAAGTLGYLSGRATRGQRDEAIAVTPSQIEPLPPAPIPKMPETVAPLGPQPPRQVAVVTHGLSFGGGIEDLSSRDARSLISSLDALSAALPDEPSSDLELGTSR